MSNKNKKIILLLSLSLFFTSCGQNSKNIGKRIHKPINLTYKSKSFKQGVYDGCKTASLNYKKNSNEFKNNIEYNKGWWAGRRNCEGGKYIY